MYRNVLAFDFDGTLADQGVVSDALSKALEDLHASGYVLFLVTGRATDSVKLGPLAVIFTGIVWENGSTAR